MVKNIFLIKYYFFKEQIFVFLKYYKNKKFAFADILLLIFSFFYNPYRVSRKFLKKRKEKDLYVYGETPLSTFEKIAKRSNITSKDSVLELGSGRGKICFWLSCYLGCKTYAVEFIPLFVKISKFISKILKIKNIYFFCGDILDFQEEKIDVAYLYGSNLESDEIKKIIKKYGYIDKFITISYPLCHYLKGHYKIVDKFSVSFPWGNTDCYINKKID